MVAQRDHRSRCKDVACARRPVQHDDAVSGATGMLPFSTIDLVAILWFVGVWIAYSFVIEATAYGRRGLNALMNRYRDVWMQRLIARDMRMVDAQVIAALQNGTAFFASTSLIAVGGALTVLRSTDEVLEVVAALPFGLESARIQWEMKVMGLVIILVYAFFKFAWSYRLFNYLAIMIGAAPPVTEKDAPESADFARRAALVLADAGRHFNRGQRALFFALGYLGWFIGPVPFAVTTAGVVAVLWHRQFASTSRRAVRRD
jgi:uncharacterized membrane protein